MNSLPTITLDRIVCKIEQGRMLIWNSKQSATEAHDMSVSQKFLAGKMTPHPSLSYGIMRYSCH